MMKKYTSSMAKFVVGILNEAWQTKRGRKYAESIAFRQLPFGEFIHIQVRLWASEGLRLVVSGKAGKSSDRLSGKEKSSELSGAQDAILWKLINDTYAEFSAGGLTEEDIMTLVLAGIEEDSYDKWGKVAERLRLPPHLYGPVAYVLGRHHQLNLERQEDARRFFEAARTKTAEGSLLRSLVEAELKPSRP
jgi:hypothetical protein